MQPFLQGFQNKGKFRMVKNALRICFVLAFFWKMHAFPQSSYEKAEEIKSPQLRKEIAQLRAEVKRLKARVEHLNQTHKPKSRVPTLPDSTASVTPKAAGNH
jgi:uncharacterized protein YlxW (UPF0749 family)